MTTQSGLKIILEDPADAQIVRAILGQSLAKRVRFFAAQGRAALATVGRNVLFHEGGPVLLVMDSKTLDPQLTAEVQSMNKVAMGSAITSGGQSPVLTADPPQFQVFTFVPEIEAVFFEAPQALELLLGRTIPQERVKEGRLVPKQTLSELLNNTRAPRDYQMLLTKLDSQIQQSLASGKQAAALKDAIESMLASSIPPSLNGEGENN